MHARNLRELSDRENLGNIELYERGYGKDAANIAKDAISYAASQAFDVVLIDTAGRRHNDARLMGSLEKFAQFARPDKILMVGEALVGTDSVAQARAFDKAFGKERHLDGFIISKCDTVGDMIGSLVSMVHATGIPVVFLGVGQHYGDLQTLVSQPILLLEDVADGRVECTVGCTDAHDLMYREVILYRSETSFIPDADIDHVATTVLTPRRSLPINHCSHSHYTAPFCHF